MISFNTVALNISVSYIKIHAPPQKTSHVI